MSISLFDITAYREHLDNGTLILTPNRRIRAKMLQSYAQSLEAEGQSSWNTPNVHSLEGWIRQQYEAAIYENRDLVDGHCVLTPDQETSIWEHVVQSAQTEAGILNHRSAAEQAAKAYKTMCLWQESIDPQTFKETDATEAFATWAHHFEAACGHMNVTPAARIPEVVLKAYQGDVLNRMDLIVMVGFDDVPPVYQKIVDAVAGEVVHEEVAPVASGKASLLGAMDDRDEIRLAAMWAQSMVLRDKGATVGVIVPDLGQRRDEVHRTFSSILDPNHLRVDVNNYAPVFNISAGEPLFSQPLIVAAMDVLALNRKRLSAGTVQRLMLSPLIGGGVNESEVRAKAWRKLSKRKDQSVDLSRLIAETENAGTLQATLQAAVDAIADPGGSKLPSEWAADIADQLSAAGWPGDVGLSSVEYQTVKAFHRVLHEVAGNDPVMEKITLKKAISVLARLVMNTPFQPETKDSPVQVLGALEGAGLNFDYVWVMGMRDDKWPAAPSPTPFIPIHLQRSANMPNSSPERELEFTRSLTKRYSTAGKQVVFSYPMHDKENEVTPSSMVAHLSECERSAITEHFVPSHEFWAPGRGVSVQTSSEVEVPLEAAGGRMKGGVAVFKDHIMCEFRGFAKHRLKVEQIEAPEEGVDHGVRGQLSHLMMQNVWSELKDQASLLALMADPEQLGLLLKGCAEQTVNGWERADHLSDRVKSLEEQRLIEMALSWLKIDESRDPFTVVEMEKDSEVDVHGITIKIKRDRVDDVHGHGRVVLDYKENAPSLSGWDPENLFEPQIPIGAVTLENADAVVGTAFASLNRDKQALTGYASCGSVAPGMKVVTPDEFQEMREKWNETLQDVSARILRGTLDIEPISESLACAKCELRSICRKGLKSSLAA